MACGVWVVICGLWFMVCALWVVVCASVVCGLYNNKGFIHWVILPTGWTDSWLVGGYP